MLNALKKNWTVYLIEAWGLGLLMMAVVGFVILIEHPSLPIRYTVTSEFVRRRLIGIIVGLTTIGIIYSGWGKRSGAHINPAVTLAQYQLDRINGYDAVWYMIFQFVGSIVGAAVLIALPQVLTAFQEYEHLLLGAIIIVSMIFMRDGIVPTLSRRFARVRG